MRVPSRTTPCNNHMQPSPYPNMQSSKRQVWLLGPATLLVCSISPCHYSQHYRLLFKLPTHDSDCSRYPSRRSRCLSDPVKLYARNQNSSRVVIILPAYLYPNWGLSPPWSRHSCVESGETTKGPNQKTKLALIKHPSTYRHRIADFTFPPSFQLTSCFFFLLSDDLDSLDYKHMKIQYLSFGPRTSTQTTSTH